MTGHRFLFKIIDAGSENLLIHVSGNVLVQTFSDTFRMAHFSQNTSVETGDAFNRINGTVGIEFTVKRRFFAEVNILGGNLAVLNQFFIASSFATKRPSPWDIGMR